VKKMAKSSKIQVQGIDVSVVSIENNDYICLTDIANSKEGDSRAADVIKNWIRTRTTLEFIGTWEQLYNPSFKVVEFDHFKMQAGLPSFVLSPGLWIQKTSAIGFLVKLGKQGGTYAHRDIAFEFCSAISPIFKLFLIKEFQRLKEIESNQYRLEWNLQRTISKINYRIHTDSIKENLIPREITKQQANFIYANEADLLNVALFGMTAKEWKEINRKENIRESASLEQLVVLSNIESINALLISHNIDPKARLKQLNDVAISQMKSLLTNKAMKKLK
jgi:KilA-N domain